MYSQGKLGNSKTPSQTAFSWPEASNWMQDCWIGPLSFQEKKVGTADQALRIACKVITRFTESIQENALCDGYLCWLLYSHTEGYDYSSSNMAGIGTMNTAKM